MRIVAFDFDGTITAKDSFLEFIKFSKGKRALYSGILLYSPLLLAFKLRLYPAWKAKQALFSYFYKGVSSALFDEWGKSFAKQITTFVRPKAMVGIKAHQQSNDRIVIVSASIAHWIVPWAKSEGIDFVLATLPEIDLSGKLTGKFYSLNCSGKEKVNRLLELFPNRREYELWAYGDSKGDQAMIEFADKGWYNRFK
jgi:HAD superfamily hydrolase (TIGR01490 family)